MNIQIRNWQTLFLILVVQLAGVTAASAQDSAKRTRRFATSDNHSGYVHWIDLYDADNRRIDPAAEKPRPYSPAKTCGRCHDFDTISHGWHFNAVQPDAEHGRPGQPWIWTDERTGTHLPLSYRGWEGTFDPDELGLSRWQVAEHFGGFLPGGGVGAQESLDLDKSETVESESEAAGEDKVTAEDEEDEKGEEESLTGFLDRSHITGELPVDCMLCHRNTGSGYSPFVWTEQIEEQNFAYAPTAAIGLGVVSGSMRRLKDDFDSNAEGAEDKLPKVAYEQGRFRNDGKVFFDLVRKPKSDSCYYCHTNIDSRSVQGERWLHDEDIHIRAGMGCADCHRNGLDHHTVRGFDNETHAAGKLAAALSCQGCHLGNESADLTNGFELPGRLGAPKPEHRGLPPVHFEKMTCTACHSGPLPEAESPRQINSIAHHLGDHIKRDGSEGPAIFAGLNLPLGEAEHELYTPHRIMFPSFWGVRKDDELKPLNPELVYELIRKPLKVKRDFTEDLAAVKFALSERKELLGEDRARVREEDRTEKEQEIMAAAEAEKRKAKVQEQMHAALSAIEAEFPDAQAVYISGGAGFIIEGEGLGELTTEDLGQAAKPYAWPMAHNVRPARQSLGATGCLECHGEDPLFFNSKLLPVGLLPDQETEAIVVHELQGADMDKLALWSEMFAGRSTFKMLGLVALGITSLIAVCAICYNLGRAGGKA